MRFYLCPCPKAFCASPLPLLWLAGMVLVGCSRARVDDAVVPAGALPTFTLLTDSTGTATLKMDSLAGGRPFTITFGTFSHGRMELAAATGTLRYTATDTSRRWAKDSAAYTFCQASQCRDGMIKVRNVRYRPDTTVVGPQPDTCVPLPLRRFTIGEAETMRISLGFTTADTGTLVVSNVAYTLRQIGGPHSTSFDYIASGGQQNYYSGFDAITYSGTVNGRRVCGTIEVLIGDSCQPRAKPDVVARAPSGPTTILPATLLSNDVGCAGERSTFNLRLKPAIYTGSLQLPTRLGTITDTIIQGSQALVYRRLAGPQAGADSFFYYIQNHTTDPVTRANVSLP